MIRAFFSKSFNGFRTFVRGVTKDYKEASLEVQNLILEKPFKSALKAFILALGSYSYSSNPSINDHNEQSLLNNLQLTLVPKDIRNSITTSYLESINAGNNNKTLRVWSFGLFSILWLDDHSDECASFKAICSHTKPTYYEIFTQRIIDIGYWGEWRRVQSVMTDYDINHNEWTQ